MRRTLALALMLALAACSGGGVTLSEYSSEVAALVETLDSRLDAEAEDYFSGAPSVEGAREYVHVRVAGYREIVERISDINPPGEVAELHATLQEILTNLLTAEEARAAFADNVVSLSELDLIWEGPEARAIHTAEQEAIVLCHAAQTRFDETEQREAFADVPWMPSELKDVVRVALDCP